jgi:hypothetical protein
MEYNNKYIKYKIKYKNLLKIQNENNFLDLLKYESKGYFPRKVSHVITTSIGSTRFTKRRLLEANKINKLKDCIIKNYNIYIIEYNNLNFYLSYNNNILDNIDILFKYFFEIIDGRDYYSVIEQLLNQTQLILNTYYEYNKFVTESEHYKLTFKNINFPILYYIGQFYNKNKRLLCNISVSLEKFISIEYIKSNEFYNTINEKNNIRTDIIIWNNYDDIIDRIILYIEYIMINIFTNEDEIIYYKNILNNNYENIYYINNNKIKNNNIDHFIKLDIDIFTLIRQLLYILIKLYNINKNDIETIRIEYLINVIIDILYDFINNIYDIIDFLINQYMILNSPNILESLTDYDIYNIIKLYECLTIICLIRIIYNINLLYYNKILNLLQPSNSIYDLNNENIITKIKNLFIL